MRIVLLISFLCFSSFNFAQFLPEVATGYSKKIAVNAKNFMVVAAHPLAVEAGYKILKQNGSAADAAIAVQLVLNLVEPQSSGIGGGAFILHYGANNKSLVSYDGRETAPQSIQPNYFLDANGKPLKFYDAVIGGKSVGVPGVLRAFELLHKKHGKLVWRKLFEPAIDLAEKGFPISPRLHELLKQEKYLSLTAPPRNYFYHDDGSPKNVGERLMNPEFAAVLRRIAEEGVDSFYKGDIAQAIVNTVAHHLSNPGYLNEQDLAAYQAKERSPVCGFYRLYKICSMGPPSSGGITMLQMLGMLERFDLSSMRPNSVSAVHLFSEAGRLAYADRNKYIADADFINVPVQSLLATEYLKQRSLLINSEKSMGVARPGEFAGFGNQAANDYAFEFPSTSHVAIIDAAGNAVSMTTTIEDGFGSRLMVKGFLLNNQLTDFSFAYEEDGKLIANRIEPNKRPRSSMTPTIVFDGAGNIKMMMGSPGGSMIINYVAKTVIGVLDWNLGMQQAISLPNFGNRNGPTEIEKGSNLEALKPALEKIGHTVKIIDLNSGLHGILRIPSGWSSGADPRREGIGLGD